MDALIEEMVLSLYAVGTEIIDTHCYQPGYRDYPMRVSVRPPEGVTQQCVIKAGGRIETEARVLLALAELGLPVPAVLAGPIMLTDQTETRALVVMSELPGQPLPWLGVTSLAEADFTCRLLIRGVLRLHQLTEAISRHPVAAALPQVTLSAELKQIRESSGEWSRVDLFARAVDRLHMVLSDIRTPLVFSNGDYNPLNFLHDGKAISGWLDFEAACLEDPHIGFAKFQIWRLDEYGWGTGMKAGLIERYLYAQNTSRREFAPRLVLRCLRHLQREVSLEGEEDARQREFMLNVLQEGLSSFDE